MADPLSAALFWGSFLRVNNEEHAAAAGATLSAYNERVSLNGIFIFSSVRERKEETLIPVLSDILIPLRPSPAP